MTEVVDKVIRKTRKQKKRYEFFKKLAELDQAEKRQQQGPKHDKGKEEQDASYNAEELVDLTKRMVFDDNHSWLDPVLFHRLFIVPEGKASPFYTKDTILLQGYALSLRSEEVHGEIQEWI